MMDPNHVQFLQQQGFSSGLIRAFGTQRQASPLRVWILDNSVHMNVRDAHILRQAGNTLQSVDATRWEELKACVAYHTQMAAKFSLPTRFALLNRPTTTQAQAQPLPQYFSLAQAGHNLHQEYQTVTHIMTHAQPNGPAVPLSKELRILRDYIVSITPQLRAANQIVPIIFATQGLPTNEQGQSSPAILQEFVDTLRSFKDLPVWAVVRLCTDDERAFEWYNGMDGRAIQLDCLDDFYGEAVEIYLHNPWLTYGLPLHRFREMGFQIPVLDALDEQALSVVQLRDLCHLLFGNFASPLPDPTFDWNGFLRVVHDAQSKEQSQWNPIGKSYTPWMNLAHVNSIYGPRVSVPPSMPSYNNNNGYGQHPHQQCPPSPQQQRQQPQQQQHYSGFQHQPQERRSYPQPGTQQQPFQPQNPFQQQHNQQQQYFQPQERSSFPQPGTQQPPPTQERRSFPQPGTQQQSPPPTKPIQDAAQLKQAVSHHWAKQPPMFTLNKPIRELLGTMDSTFPFVEPHEYFQKKFHPFAKDALQSGDEVVLKRAVRKVKFFLHPDKLPKDFNPQQLLLCRTLWDFVSESWEEFNNNESK